MSCRILTQGEKQIERLDWRVIGPQRAPASGRIDASDRSQPSSQHDDTNRLRARVAELERALESEVRQTKDRAYQEGQKAGIETAAAEIQPALDRLLRAYADVAAMRARIRRETESDIVTLTIAIARRVLRRELSVDPDAIHGVVKAALERVQTKDICLVRVHPEYLARVRAFFESSGIAGLEITSDPSLQPGGLVLETKRGNLDASIETQLKEIERGFTDRIAK